MSVVSGVYCIRNKTNNRCYIGSSVDLYRRFSAHKSNLNKNAHANPALQNAWNKYGSDAFSFEILMLCPIEELIENEQRYIDITKYLYNMSDRAELPMLGKKHSEETKQKMSKSRKGQLPWNTGLSLSENHKRNIGIGNIGKKVGIHYSYDVCKRMSNGHKGIPGHPHTEETKIKMSIAKKGVPFTEEHKKHISEGQSGLIRGPHSEEHKRKIGESVRATKLMNKNIGEQSV